MEFLPRLKPEQKKEILNHLQSFITEERKRKFEHLIQFRTRYITIVLEDIFQPHNASAVLRTCECFGIQDVHIIENSNPYRINPDVALGSTKWLSLFRYNRNKSNTNDCLKGLKINGYHLIAATPHEKNHPPETLSLDHPIAILFGTELEGLSQETLHQADGFITIPMVGFTESLNISVSAAIIMYTLISRLHSSSIHWQLKPNEITDVMLQWHSSSITKSDLIIRRFIRKKGWLIP